MNKIQNLKGFRDFLPGEALKREWLKKKISDTFKLWGYDPLETPTLEPLELFAGQIGEDEKLFFKFKDPGGRDVALRYDQTVPTCRVVGQYGGQLVMPFKRFQIQSAFRAENTQKGRYREFLQADADIFGIDSPFADAEVIALSLDIYKQIGFKRAKVLINDRTLLKDFPYEAIVAIDKIKKIGADGVIKTMENKGITFEDAKKYLQTIKNLQPNETIKTILNYLKSAGYPPDWYEFDPTIARSFSYSSGVIWEVEIPDYPGSSILGGEHYDKLIEKISGAQIPGTGFAVGFDRTFEAAVSLNLIPQVTTNTHVLVTIFDSSLQTKSLEVAMTLRNAHIQTELYPDPNAKLEKQLKYADRKGIPFCVIIGPQEAGTNKVKLKNMKEKSQEVINMEELIKNYAHRVQPF